MIVDMNDVLDASARMWERNLRRAGVLSPHRKRRGDAAMSLGTLLLIILVLLLLGGLVPFGGAPAPGAPAPFYRGYGYGWGAAGILGPIIVIVLVLALLGAV